MFGMRSHTLSKVFWKSVECFIENFGYLISNFRKYLIERRTAMCAQAITNEEVPHSHCVASIDCTKIDMSRPGGRSACQRILYLGTKGFSS